MRIGRASVVILTALLVFSSGGAAQVRKGLREVNFLGNLTAIGGGDDTFTLFSLATAYGYFVTEHLEVGPSFSLTKAESVDLFGTFSGFLAAHFPGAEDARVVPYLGGQIGIGFNDGLSPFVGAQRGATPFIGPLGDETPFIFGVFGGVKAFVHGGGGAVTVQPFYMRQQFEEGGLNNYGVFLGISIFSPRK